METINIPFSTGEDYQEWLLSQNLCPNCETVMEIMVEPNYPDPNDYPVALYCDKCKFLEQF